ncbi:hypothetical protein B0H10DRAFT_1951834 [Mycena sp. CBHHK59/15]|nr:hypothetical protein B0H10DRAFT_1951834 [Mycena sp. CBHHK59/15]
MSILVDRIYTSLESPVTILSAAFMRSHLFPGHPARFALTINGGPHRSFTVELECTISSQLPVDISLGLDWKASVREWLITLGLQPSDEFGYLHAVDLSPSSLVSASSKDVADLLSFPQPYPGRLQIRFQVYLPILLGLGVSYQGKYWGNPIGGNAISPSVNPVFMHGTPAAFAYSNPVSVLSNNVFTHQYKPVNAVLVEPPPPIQGPSFSRSVFGPMFPLSPSMGLDALFLSSDPLTNAICSFGQPVGISSAAFRVRFC